jgi:hypothetical protein
VPARQVQEELEARPPTDEELDRLLREFEPFAVAVQHGKRVLRDQRGDLVEYLGAVRVAADQVDVPDVADPPERSSCSAFCSSSAY